MAGSARAESLAATVRDVAAAWAHELAALTPEQWRMTAVNSPDIVKDEDEKRPVGVIVHHLAVALPLHADMARQLAQGEPVQMPTWDAEALAALNARHAAANADPDQSETMRLLESGAASLASCLEGLTDEELDRSGRVYGWELTAEQFVRRIAIGHGNWHLSSIRATIGS